MKFYYVYILRCSDGTFYTGITNNVEARLNQHNAGLNPESYTYTRRPVSLEYIQEFTDPAQAIAFEKKFKKWSKAKKRHLLKMILMPFRHLQNAEMHHIVNTNHNHLDCARCDKKDMF
ncbi:GIY-YIG nuclease family protein [Flavobacterium coralii]|uniref:GIY-YIG nuclease family protein n=1 Tax=Flavobacterium coralii TaxID=2838017 RepID=UPI00293D2816|nr:GIY-YIG nuclease family protein [Flavobacterium coralii]